jgi:hypothetical protein
MQTAFQGCALMRLFLTQAHFSLFSFDYFDYVQFAVIASSLQFFLGDRLCLVRRKNSPQGSKERDPCPNAVTQTVFIPTKQISYHKLRAAQSYLMFNTIPRTDSVATSVTTDHYDLLALDLYSMRLPYTSAYHWLSPLRFESHSGRRKEMSCRFVAGAPSLGEIRANTIPSSDTQLRVIREYGCAKR